MHGILAGAYDQWTRGNIDGFLEVFPDDAVFVVPGSTRLSGDHDKKSFRLVLNEVVQATKEGRHRQELVCSYEGPSGTIVVFDTFVSIEGAEEKYHSAHEWILREGVPQVWMLYIHEYELFGRVWG
ncbi:MAG TPA: hypothetical protein VGR90_09375 [Acidimicrobiales bacterium]|nr:hypothetical protein [Acidimicrobiales bacterium]